METLNKLYKLYLEQPLATVADHSTNPIYANGWCEITGLAFMPPHPHKHLSFEDFEKVYNEDISLLQFLVERLLQ